MTRPGMSKARALEELRRVGVIGEGYEECAPLEERKRVADALEAAGSPAVAALMRRFAE